jgi:hypothetical protein
MAIDDEESRGNSVRGVWGSAKVRLEPESGLATQAPFEIPLDMFMLNYHVRRTGWDRLDRVAFVEPPYLGPVQRLHYVKFGDRKVVIEERARSTWRTISEEIHEAKVANNGYDTGFAEGWEPFERAKAWALVLGESPDPFEEDGGECARVRDFLWRSVLDEAIPSIAG